MTIEEMTKCCNGEITGCERQFVNDLKAKYQKLLDFAIWTQEQNCCLMCQCISCRALEVLREVEEA
jgi:hypothetical protein